MSTLEDSAKTINSEEKKPNDDFSKLDKTTDQEIKKQDAKK